MIATCHRTAIFALCRFADAALVDKYATAAKRGAAHRTFLKCFKSVAILAQHFQTSGTLQHGSTGIAVRLKTLVAAQTAPLGILVHTILTPVAALAEFGVALAVGTKRLVTLLTMSHWFGVTFVTEMSVALVAQFHQVTSMAIRLIAQIAMLQTTTTHKRRALEFPAVGTLLAHVFLTIPAESLVRIRAKGADVLKGSGS